MAKKKSFKEVLEGMLTEDELKQMHQAVIESAKEGNLKAYEIIRDIIYGKPTTRVELEQNEKPMRIEDYLARYDDEGNRVPRKRVY